MEMKSSTINVIEWRKLCGNVEVFANVIEKLRGVLYWNIYLFVFFEKNSRFFSIFWNLPGKLFFLELLRLLGNHVLYLKHKYDAKKIQKLLGEVEK